MNYISIKELSEKWKISKRRIQIFCTEGRINGAKKIGNMWVVPEDAVRPHDEREKSVVYTASYKELKTRSLLKKMISKAISICQSYSMNPLDSQKYIIHVLASSVFNLYIDPSDFWTCYKVVSDDEQIRNLKCIEDLKNLSEELLKRSDIVTDNLIAWAYQYIKLIIPNSEFAKTQFFTEQYMIDFLIRNIPEIQHANKIIDPCCGGGNFLASSLTRTIKNEGLTSKKEILSVCTRINGYDIDSEIVKIALINIRLTILESISLFEKVTPEDWYCIKPHLFISEPNSKYGSLCFDHSIVKDICYDREESINNALGNADVVLTNPPFETIKGMAPDLRDFLKSNYPESNADVCAAFITALGKMINRNGVIGVVTQSSWMYLNSFKSLRVKYINDYSTRLVAELGSGAFLDLSGEKANVSLLIFKKGGQSEDIKFTNLRDRDYEEKVSLLFHNGANETLESSNVFKADGSPFNFEINNELQEITANNNSYGEYARPMQGTSTGDARNLIDYYWNHIGDPDWKLVSKGGGYSRWEGLNSYVVKWGKNGEYIKETKGSAIRNSKFFNATQLVFSDTGTSGLNVRKLLDGQIFVASGPGIRVLNGNSYAHLAYLNSRIASCYMRLLSPKLTIAPGYISRLPANSELFDSVILATYARRCVDQKIRFLRKRPVNYEFDYHYLSEYTGKIDEIVEREVVDEINDELLKLKYESVIENEIFRILNISNSKKEYIDNLVGKNVIDIHTESTVDIKELDKLIAKNLDCRCQLKKVRTNKHGLGCDGILEFVSKKICLSPVYIAKLISENISSFSNTLALYKKMTLQNIFLEKIQFSPQKGIGRKITEEDIISDPRLSEEDAAWITNNIYTYNRNFFYNNGFLNHEKRVDCENE